MLLPRVARHLQMCAGVAARGQGWHAAPAEQVPYEHEALEGDPAGPQQGAARPAAALLLLRRTQRAALDRSPAPTALAASMRCGSTSLLIILEVRPPESSSHATWVGVHGPRVSSFL